MSDASASEDDDASPETLRERLREYEAQLADVDAALAEDGDDAELRELRVSLVEIVGVAREVLETALSARTAGERAGGASAGSEAPAATREGLAGTFVGRDVTIGTGAGAARGRCVRVAEDGRLDVYVANEHRRVLVHASEVRIDAGDRARGGREGGGANAPREVYKGVPEPKRFVELTMETEFMRKEPPKKLMIKPGDDSVTIEAKKKKLKSFKRRQRQQEIGAEQNAKASSWQDFQAKKKKTTGIQKGSIFALPEDLSVAKGVGFGGDVRGMTQNPTARKRGASTFSDDE